MSEVTNENQRVDEKNSSPKKHLPSKFKINRTSRKSKNNANPCSQSDLKVNADDNIGAAE